MSCGQLRLLRRATSRETSEELTAKEGPEEGLLLVDEGSPQSDFAQEDCEVLTAKEGPDEGLLLADEGSPQSDFAQED